jgi:hypothetical protein
MRTNARFHAAGAGIRYQEYAGATHVGAADKAYADEELITGCLLSTTESERR